MPIESLQDLYLEELRDLYNAEHQIIKALPQMAKGAHNPELRSAFEQHLQVTREQVRRLDSIFSELDQKPTGKKCKGMEGLLEEGSEMLKEEGDPDVKDAALIAAAQKVEHYEIASYGTVRNYARQLGLKNQVDLLQRTLDEEGETDKRLSTLAESGINEQALLGRRRGRDD